MISVFSVESCLFLWNHGKLSLSVQSFDFSTASKMTSLRFSFIFRLSDWEIFQVAKIIMVQFRPLVYQSFLSLYNVFAFKFTFSTHSFVYIRRLYMIPFAASCGLVVPVISCFRGIIGSWLLGSVGSPLTIMRLSFKFWTVRKRRWP